MLMLFKGSLEIAASSPKTIHSVQHLNLLISTLMLRDDHQNKHHPGQLRPTLQVWAVDISGYPPSTSDPQSSSIGNPSLDESVTHLLDQAGASGSGKQEATNVRKFLREVDRKRKYLPLVSVQSEQLSHSFRLSSPNRGSGI